ncbi:MAG: YciI family protein [Hyphomonadaceae bacterium]
MQFMMFVCSDSEPDAEPEAPGEVGLWVDGLGRHGKRITGDRLRPAADAKTVRVRGGRRQVTDGPFAEAKEVILGFDILECDSINEAVEIAAKHPMARAGRIEVRAFWPFEG